MRNRSRNEIVLFILTFFTFSLVTGLTTYLVTRNHFRSEQVYTEHQDALALKTGIENTRSTQRQNDESSRKDDILKLEVCINASLSTTQQTSCFREEAQGILPEPTLSDYNKLPDLY